MQILTAVPVVVGKGQLGVIMEMTTGTAKLQIKDPSASGSAFVDVPDSYVSSSSSYNVNLANQCTIQAVLTGDAECYILNAN